MPNINLIIIGGFALNHKAIPCLNELSIPSKFIDINSYPEFSSMESGVDYLESYLVQDNNIILGYSMGGLFAINLAYKFPQLISKVGIINSTPKFIRDINWNGIHLNDLEQLKSRLARLPLDQFMNYFINLALYPSANLDYVNYNCDYANLYGKTNKEHLNNLLKLIAEVDLRNILINLNTKLFCINSVLDRLVPINNLKYDCANYVLNNSTHLQCNQNQLMRILQKEICIC